VLEREYLHVVVGGSYSDRVAVLRIRERVLARMCLENIYLMPAPVYRSRKYNAVIWGPKYWFFLHTIAMTYPEYPNDVTKRKYYDLVQNMPLFLPDREMGDRFSVMLDKYPVSPYLDNRESFFRWTVFVHNKMNERLGKEEMDVEEALAAYDKQYVPEELDLYGGTGIHRTVVYMNMAIFLGLILIAYMVYF
jgi:Erv1 / Alr family